MFRRLLSVVPSWVIATALLSAATPPIAKLIIAGVLAVTLWNPVEGLIVVALLTPLGDLIGIGMRAPMRFTEAVVVAFFAGWLLRPALHHKNGPSPHVAIRYAAWGLASIVLASIAVQALHLRATAPAVWVDARSTLVQRYFEAIGDPLGAISGARVVEGLGLAAAVVVLLRAAPMVAVWIPEALGAGGAAAALASLLLWRGIAFPAVLARHALIGDRVVAHVTDLNAAGSYFALLLCLAAGMSARERNGKRLGWLAVAASALVGLWLCDSRSATAAVVLTGTATAVWLMTRRWPARTLAGTPDDYRLLGLTSGVAAFLLTCVTGHPLLVSEVAYPFWIAAGLLLVLASPVRHEA